jgi:VanZ family protein
MAGKLNFWSVFTFVWAAFILIISVMPAKELPTVSLWKADKLAHAIVYLLLTISLALTLRKSTANSGIKAGTVAAASSLFYGIIIEIIQGSVLVNRLFDVYDIVANTFGCVLGYLAIIFTQRRKSKFV